MTSFAHFAICVFNNPRFTFPVSCVMFSVSCFACSVPWFAFLRVWVFTFRASRFVFRDSFLTFPVPCFGSHAPCFALLVSRFPSSAPASLLRVWHCVCHARGSKFFAVHVSRLIFSSATSHASESMMRDLRVFRPLFHAAWLMFRNKCVMLRVPS